MTFYQFDNVLIISYCFSLLWFTERRTIFFTFHLTNFELVCFFLVAREGPEVRPLRLDHHGEFPSRTKGLLDFVNSFSRSVGKLRCCFCPVEFLVFPLQWWKNDFIRWNPDDFCGIDYLSIPSEFLWKPDITIVEM